MAVIYLMTACIIICIWSDYKEENKCMVIILENVEVAENA